MDTPTIAAYYREEDPIKRRKILEKSITDGEEPELNEIRKEIWEARYSAPTETGTRADGFLKLWMNLGFNKKASEKMFRFKGALKAILKELDEIHFTELKNKSELHRELMYRECLHLVNIYISLCERDKSYTTYLLGIMQMK